MNQSLGTELQGRNVLLRERVKPRWAGRPKADSVIIELNLDHNNVM